MNFYTKRRKRPAVPIVTLIDILAILLIFFIVTTTFKKEETLVKVNLPTSSELGADVSAETRQALSLGKDGSVSLGAAAHFDGAIANRSPAVSATKSQWPA